jgi:hypothetical protein
MSSELLVSYTTPYDHYVGQISVGDLTMEEQDLLIRSVFDTDSDFRADVVRLQARKSQLEGLWTVVVLIGTALEEQKRIKSFDNRTEGDIDEIVSALAGTNLWLRVEEVFPPFNSRRTRTAFNWSELEPIQMEDVAELAGEPLTTVKTGLLKHLSRRPIKQQSEIDDRMPYHAFKPLYELGKVSLFVDKGLAPSAGAAGVVSTNAPYFVFFSVGLFIASPILWFAHGLPYGLACLASAVFVFRYSKKITVEAVRSAAIHDRDKYRWLMSRSVVWLKT